MVGHFCLPGGFTRLAFGMALCPDRIDDPPSYELGSMHRNRFHGSSQGLDEIDQVPAVIFEQGRSDHAIALRLTTEDHAARTEALVF